MATRYQAKVVSAVPTLDTSAYASGDRMGTVMTLTGVFDVPSGAAELTSVTIIDQAGQSAALDILFFTASPTVASADNAAIDISDAEMLAKCVGSVTFAASDYKATASNSVGTLKNIGLVLQGARNSATTISDSQNLYALLVSRGSPTYAASSLKLLFGVKPV